jgi:hypothetical protein
VRLVIGLEMVLFPKLSMLSPILAEEMHSVLTLQMENKRQILFKKPCNKGTYPIMKVESSYKIFLLMTLLLNYISLGINL